MAIKLIALDLDDTLLGADLKVSPANREALHLAMDRGVVVVLASGRPTAGMLQIAADLDLARRGGWIVAFNGGQIYNCATGQVLWENSLSRSEGLDILAVARREGLGFLSYNSEGIITPQANEWTQVEHTLTGLPVLEYPDFEHRLPDRLPKVILLGSPDKVAAQVEPRRAEFGSRWNIVTSKPFFLEFTPFGIEKGSALQRLVDHLGLSAEQALALGDGHNDIPMITWAGTGVAMDNAAAAVKEAADWVTGHHDQNGVAHAIHKFVLSHPES